LMSSVPGGGEGYDDAVEIAVARLGEGLEGLDGRELAARLGDVERTIRKLEAVAASIVATADRRGVFGEDGHVSVRGWVKASICPCVATGWPVVRWEWIRWASWPGCSPTRGAVRSWRRWSTR
jgi:hypothetical protein